MLPRRGRPIAIHLVVLLAVALAPTIGTAGIHRWTPVGVEGGLIGLIVPQPGAPGTVWASVDGQLFRSVDGGTTWAARSNGLPFFASPGDVLEMAFDASQPGTALLATGQGVLRTTDAGNAWTLVFGWQGVSTITHVAADPFVAGTLYVLPGGASLRPLRSTDHGATWTAIGTPPRPGTVDTTIGFTLDPNVPGTFYVPMFHLGTTYLLVSEDFGTTWETRSGGLSNADYNRFSVVPTNPATLYVVASGGLQRSTDGGMTYSQTGLGRTDIALLAVDSADPAVLYARPLLGPPLPILRSPDGGASWFPVAVDVAGLPTPTVYGLATDPFVSGRIWLGTNFGILSTSDGGATWAYASRGLSRQHVACDVVPVVGTPTLYTSTATAIWRSDDVGLSWQPRTPEFTPTGPYAPRFRLAVDPTNADVVYAASSTDGVFKSTDGALSWNPASAGLTDLAVAAIAVDPTSPQVLYAATGAGLFRTTDGGVSWTPRNAGLQASDIAVDPFLPTTLYFDSGVRTSSDAGLTTTVPSLFNPFVFPPPGAFLVDFSSTLALDPSTPGRAYVGVGALWYYGANTFQVVDEFHRTSDRLATTTFLDYLAPGALAVDPIDPLTVYVGWSSTVGRSRDGGFTRTPYGSGFHAAACKLAVDPSSATVYAGTSRLPGETFDDGILAITNPPCGSAADCDDGNGCTVDTCVSGHCEYAITLGAPCTGTDPCPFSGTCANDGNCYRALNVPLCDDGDGCTDDVCTRPGTCNHHQRPFCECSSDAECDDGDACTTDRCVTFGSGRVCSSTPIDCDDGDPCTADACDAGTCTTTPSCTDRVLAGGRLVVARRPGGSKLVLRSRDPALDVPAPGGPDDPTTGGAVVDLFASAGGSASLTVPAGPEWQMTTGARTIYRYLNRAAPGGPSPVRTVQLRSAAVLKLLARSAGLPVTSPLGAIGVRIRTGQRRYCARFAADVDVVGRFVGTHTLPITDCSDGSLGG